MIEFAIELQIFKKMCKAVSLDGIIETPLLRFTQEGLEAINRDLGDAMFSYCKFSSEYFMKYNYPEGDDQAEEKVFISSQALLEAVKSLSGESVRVFTQEDSLVMKTDKQKAGIPILEGGSIAKIPDFMKTTDGDVSISDDLVFQIEEIIPTVTKEVKSLGASDSIFIMKDGILSLFQAKDGSNFENDLLKGLKSIDFSVTVETMYLTSLFNSVMDENIKLKLGKELPVVMENKAKNRHTIFVLMPKIVSE